MYKTFVISAFVVLMAAIILLGSDLKNAYKLLPGSTSPTMPAPPPYADWREFVARSGKFKVLLPAVPQYAKEAVDIPNMNKKRQYEMYVSEKINGTIFLISLITYPSDVDTSNTQEMLHGIVEEMMGSKPGNQLISEKAETFDHYPATDFSIRNKETNIQGKAFMINKTIYLLTYIAKKADFEEGEYQHFIDSFQLLKDH